MLKDERWELKPVAYLVAECEKTTAEENSKQTGSTGQLLYHLHKSWEKMMMDCQV